MIDPQTAYIASLNAQIVALQSQVDALRAAVKAHNEWCDIDRQPSLKIALPDADEAKHD